MAGKRRDALLYLVAALVAAIIGLLSAGATPDAHHDQISTVPAYAVHLRH